MKCTTRGGGEATVQYMGGKARIARQLAEVMIARRPRNCSLYLEPFLGGCNVLPHMAMHFESSYASDVQPDLVMLWRAAMDGWQPPAVMAREEWLALQDNDGEPSALRAFARFGCSFGGEWGSGYAVNNPRHGADYAGAARRGILRKVALLRGAVVSIDCIDYRRYAPGADTLAYLDPPYAGTQSFRGVGVFNQVDFWATANEWVGNGATVFVSGYDAPSGWLPVWVQARGQMNGLIPPGSTKREALFQHRSQIDRQAAA